MEFVTSVVLNGAFLISVLALVALGLGVIDGLLGVINMAHGELVAIGAYTAVVVVDQGASYWLALIIAPLVGMAIGMLLETALISRLIDRPLDAILITLGLSLVTQQLLKIWFGASPRSVSAPVSGTFSVLGVTYPVFRVVVVVIATAMIGAAFLFFTKSSFGLVVRAIFQNRDSALTNGVKAASYNRIAFGVGAGLAAFAGSLLAPSAGVLPQMGAVYIGPAFIAVTLGGSYRLMGAVAGAAFMGGFESFIGESWTRTWAKVLVLVLAVIVIRLRPSGLLNQPKARVA